MGKSRNTNVVVLCAVASGVSITASTHGIEGGDATFVTGQSGAAVTSFIYLGAKHMLTGYDHLLFLLGVVFWLKNFRDILVYVTLFAAGHSLTLIAATFFDLCANEYFVDALIGASVVWKAFDNLGGSIAIFGYQPDNKFPVFGFGLIHGLGLATKLQGLNVGGEGLLVNLLAFNAGVEIGQLIGLLVVFSLEVPFKSASWNRVAVSARFTLLTNSVMMFCGFVLIALHLTYFFDQ